MTQGRLILAVIGGFVSILMLFHPLPSTIYGTVFGRVTDEDTGKGVANVGVNIQGYGRGNRSTLTDKDGRYTIRTLESGEYSILFRAIYPHCNVSPLKIVYVGAGERVEVNHVIKLGGTIVGKVYHADGKTPLPGVSVQAFALNAGGETTTTGEDGSYILGKMGRLCPSERYYIKADCKIPGLASKLLLWIAVEKGGETKAQDIIFDLNDITGVEGYVTSSIDDRPIEGSYIVFYNIEKLEPVRA